MRLPVLYIIAPCYNEAEIIRETTSALLSLLRSMESDCLISADSRILYADDGSCDATWDIIKSLTQENKDIHAIRLSRNRGHQNALMAALMYSRGKCDAAVTVDADLQDDISKIPQMVAHYLKGAQIVYGVRVSRAKDTRFKRISASMFYRLLTFLGVEIVGNHADFRLMSSAALDALSEFSEVNLFLRAMAPLIGFKTARVTYERQKRIGGKTKYPLRKMISFSLDAITSFSIKPIRIISSIGLFVFLISIIMLIYSLVQHFAHQTVIGWSSLIISVWALGGLQLLAIGVIGEYIGKIYIETKRRPRYIIEEIIDK
ncbi:MAG: glycosyltransferase family 2 protein [Clostridia bacterium]|nr:glycosyltransferase family 2 protein [Clostridia bacterium]